MASSSGLRARDGDATIAGSRLLARGGHAHSPGEVDAAVHVPVPASGPVSAASDVNRDKRTRRSADREGWYPYPYTVVNETFRVCAQQVQGCGDCLFHAIAVGEAYAKTGKHLGMYDKSLDGRVAELRQVRPFARTPAAMPRVGVGLCVLTCGCPSSQLAVDTLISHQNKTLLMEDGEHISGGELVETVAQQYGLNADEYLALMRRPRVWGGGPEIVALVAALEQPIHVYEPVCANNGTDIHLCLSGRYGSPTYDDAGVIHVLAADDRFPDCGPTEIKLHGEGGNHFLALIPSEDGERCAPSSGAQGEDRRSHQ